MKRLTWSLLICLSLVQCKGPKTSDAGTAVPITSVADVWVVTDTTPVRQKWLAHLDRLARPVMTAMAQEQLHREMPVILMDSTYLPEERKNNAYLEAFGRLLAGMAPWLNGEGGSSREQALREEYRGLALKAITHAVDPASPDHLEWEHGDQRLVDASFFALAFLRAPWLWEHVDSTTRQHIVTALKHTRSVKPAFNNWILNSAAIEIFFMHYGLEWDPMRVDLSLREFDQWYVGDGMYSDGPGFHWDYYNSLVIHPFLNQVVDELAAREAMDDQPSVLQQLKSIVKSRPPGRYAQLRDRMRIRSARYAVILERLIHPDGTYPIVGRSVVYRGGAFHHLADMAWKGKLPETLHPAQVRVALTAVIDRTLGPKNSFDGKGWLNIGISGHQPHLADAYVTSGSVYMCANIFLPLGLPETDPFWAAPAEKISSQKIWGGEDGPYDHFLEE